MTRQFDTQALLASDNAFVHLIRGSRSFVQTNLATAAWALALSAAVNIGVALVVTLRILAHVSFAGSGEAQVSQLASLALGIISVVVVSLLVQAILGQALLRLILTGARNQTTTFNEALRMALQRLSLTAGAFLGILVCYVVAFGVVLILAKLAPGLAILAALAMLIASVILIFNVFYLNFVIMDDQRPQGVLDAFRRSADTWKRSQAATMLYLFVIAGLYIAVSIVIGSVRGSGQGPHLEAVHGLTTRYVITMPVFNASFVAALIVSAIIGVIVTTVIQAGLADIYNEVRPRPTRAKGLPKQG